MSDTAPHVVVPPYIPTVDDLERKRAAYRACFLGDDGLPTPVAELVLDDLHRFCKTFEPTYNVKNVNETYVREGRREVALRLLAMLDRGPERERRRRQGLPETPAVKQEGFDDGYTDV